MRTKNRWQLLFFRSFYGSSEPDMPLHEGCNPVEAVTPPHSNQGEENVLFCLHCNGAVERGLDPSADGAAPARAGNGISFGLHVSPRGVAKCVRRSERGASRPSPANGFFTKHKSRNTNHGFCGFSRFQALRYFSWSEPSPRPWFSRNTKHETRITAFWY